jgi:hypothetical protein
MQQKSNGRVWKYLKGAITVGLQYKRNDDCEPTSFVDAVDADADVDMKSVSGCVFKVYENAVDLYTKKQSTIALSPTEAELMHRKRVWENYVGWIIY